MIAYSDVGAHCHHCRKHIYEKGFREDRAYITVAYRYTEIKFCISCWKEIAGEEYQFQDQTTDDLFITVANHVAKTTNSFIPVNYNNILASPLEIEMYKKQEEELNKLSKLKEVYKKFKENNK